MANNFLATFKTEEIIRTGSPDSVHCLAMEYSLSGPLLKLALKRKDLSKQTRILLKRDIAVLKKQNKEAA
jgi:hypothetical protein